MSVWIFSEVGAHQRLAEILNVAVEIADNHNIGSRRKRHDTAPASRRLAEKRDGLAQRAQESDGIGHDACETEVFPSPGREAVPKSRGTRHLPAISYNSLVRPNLPASLFRG
jgi:hypothetical protein